MEYIYHVECDCNNKIITFGVGAKKINIENIECKICKKKYTLIKVESKNV